MEEYILSVGKEEERKSSPMLLMLLMPKKHSHKSFRLVCVNPCVGKCRGERERWMLKFFFNILLHEEAKTIDDDDDDGNDDDADIFEQEKGSLLSLVR